MHSYPAIFRRATCCTSDSLISSGGTSSLLLSVPPSADSLNSSHRFTCSPSFVSRHAGWVLGLWTPSGSGGLQQHHLLQHTAQAEPVCYHSAGAAHGWGLLFQGGCGGGGCCFSKGDLVAGLTTAGQLWQPTMYSVQPQTKKNRANWRDYDNAETSAKWSAEMTSVKEKPWGWPWIAKNFTN